MAERPAPHGHPNYIGIWIVLFVLTGVELGVAFLPFPKTVIVLLLVGLAFWKALLVALYYMHLRFEPNRLRILAIAPLPLIVILVSAVIMEYR
jgi:cytochrome c oxidase subunit 4